jgi:hypothetical protein
LEDFALDGFKQRGQSGFVAGQEALREFDFGCAHRFLW